MNTNLVRFLFVLALALGAVSKGRAQDQRNIGPASAVAQGVGMSSASKMHNLLSVFPLIESGEKTETDIYYQRVGKLINFKIEGSTLNGFLDYLGYKGISAADFETLPSEELMPTTTAEFSALAAKVTNSGQFVSAHSLADFTGDNVLVSRFFAPKIVNFNDKNPHGPSLNPFNPGWRKLVRLRAIPGSRADVAGMQTAYILFNVFEPDETKDPFKNESVNNQVMLIPKVNSTAPATLSDAAFWLLYLTRSTGYPLGFALKVGFDLPNCTIGTPGCSTTRDYFVPRACAQCHGHDTLGAALDGAPVKPNAAKTDIENTQDMLVGVYAFAKVNYLDTDQWYDMIAYDFPGTAAGQHDALFDGVKNNPSSPKHQRAFDVLRKLNTAIEKQNAGSARPDGSDKFKRLAVTKWLELHQTDASHISPIKRGLEVTAGQVWSAANADDEKLLGLLNRYCFRCHSSLKWSVFDRSALFQNGRKITIPAFVGINFMPQGRLVPPADKDDLIKYVEAIK